MRPNNICCFVVGDYIGVPACSVIAYKCPEIRVTVLGEKPNHPDPNVGTLQKTETELEQTISKCKNRNLFFSTDYSTNIREADLIFISINTSNKLTKTIEGNALNLKQLEDAVRLIVLHSETDTIIVENSRIPVQAAERITTLLPPPRQSTVRFQVISNPEFLIEGSPVESLLQPERVLIGCQNNPISRAAAKSLCELYETWIPRKNIYILTDRSAELCKLAGSAFIAQKISSINSLSELCEHTEADASEVLKILDKDTRFGAKFLHPSAGSKFEYFQKDISNLISLCKSLKLNTAASYWQAVLEMNEYQKTRCCRKIESLIGSPKGKNIAIWGFAFEKNTSDTRNSPAIEICKWLLTEESNVKIYDPEVPSSQILKDLGLEAENQKKELVSICSNVYQAVENASAVIICTDWDEFREVDYSKIVTLMEMPIIIDGKKILKHIVSTDSGIDLHTVCLNYINM